MHEAILCALVEGRIILRTSENAGDVVDLRRSIHAGARDAGVSYVLLSDEDGRSLGVLRYFDNLDRSAPDHARMDLLHDDNAAHVFDAINTFIDQRAS